ncbi:MAG: VOC family protein [Hyphomicrobiales bacterium]|nr:VOC family protein [Hyphomicrobiales bacterium]
MNIDHVVLWVEDQNRSLAFYADVLGLEPVRAQEFADGKTSFPSVRLNEQTIIDLMHRRQVSFVRTFTGGGDESGGTPVNHVCLALDALEHASLLARLAAHGVELKSGGENAFGARGHAARSDYFCDPDGNVLEVRYYKPTS